MSSKRHLGRVAIAAVCLLAAREVHAQTSQTSQPPLATIKTAKCSFATMATGTWQEGKPAAVVKPSKLTIDIDSIDVDEGTAVVVANTGGAAGRSDTIVRLAKATLHVVQMFTDGPIYATTIFPEATRPGKLQAVHTRHEFMTGLHVAGFTWQPEQYYGECEVH